MLACVWRKVFDRQEQILKKNKEKIEFVEGCTDSSDIAGAVQGGLSSDNDDCVTDQQLHLTPKGT
jgi:hypothetical protein